MENRQKICDLLLLTLKATRSKESVIIKFSNGSEKRVNVAGDSGTALISDVMRKIN